MSRIRSAFESAKAQGRGALVVYICAGDPDLETTARLVPVLAAAGADIIELGMPYTNPIADGPTIQAAAKRALAAGTTVAGILDCVRTIRADCQVPIAIMSSVSPLFRFGLERFAQEASAAGVDGVLISDLPHGEAGEWRTLAADASLDTIFLVSPNSAPERIPEIAEAATGFIYAVARAGTTGTREDLPEDLPLLIERIRAVSDKPIAVGFGVTTPEHVRQVCRMADGAIVGSAVVRAIGDAEGDPLAAASELVAQLAEATTR